MEQRNGMEERNGTEQRNGTERTDITCQLLGEHNNEIVKESKKKRKREISYIPISFFYVTEDR